MPYAKNQHSCKKTTYNTIIPRAPISHKDYAYQCSQLKSAKTIAAEDTRIPPDTLEL